MQQKEKPVTIDKFDFVHKILQAQASNTIDKNDFEMLVTVYEENTKKDVNKKKFSPNVKLTTSQKEILLSTSSKVAITL